MIGNIFRIFTGTDLKIIRFKEMDIAAVNTCAVTRCPAIDITDRYHGKYIPWIMPVLEEEFVACEHRTSRTRVNTLLDAIYFFSCNRNEMEQSRVYFLLNPRNRECY
jgi:hypothetical protein